MNNLDLAVFPCMSKRHGDFLRGHHGNFVADPDEVWKAAKQVWDDLPSATIEYVRQQQTTYFGVRHGDGSLMF